MFIYAVRLSFIINFYYIINIYRCVFYTPDCLTIQILEAIMIIIHMAVYKCHSCHWIRVSVLTNKNARFNTRVGPTDTTLCIKIYFKTWYFAILYEFFVFSDYANYDYTAYFYVYRTDDYRSLVKFVTVRKGLA